MKRILCLLLAAAPVAHGGSLIYPQYQHLVEKHAALQGLDKNLVWAVMGRESSGNRFALSHKDARGLLQVIPPTAARMGVNPKNLYDPEQNIIAGTRYLRFLTNRFKGNLDLILAGYNAGEGAVQKYGGIPPYRETQHYVRAVKARYAKLNGSPPPAVPVAAVSVSAPAAAKAVAVSADAKPAEPVRAVAAVSRRHESWDAFREF